MKKMRIRINQDGRATIKVEGGQGSNCELFTQALEKALGQIQEREFLPEHDMGEEEIRLKEQIEAKDRF